MISFFVIIHFKIEPISSPFPHYLLPRLTSMLCLGDRALGSMGSFCLEVLHGGVSLGSMHGLLLLRCIESPEVLNLGQSLPENLVRMCKYPFVYYNIPAKPSRLCHHCQDFELFQATSPHHIFEPMSKIDRFEWDW